MFPVSLALIITTLIDRKQYRERS